MSKTQTIRERYEQDLEQCRINTDEKIKARLLKKKLDINIPCDKKTLHYLLNSFLHGDVFDEDIFNQFWDFHFRAETTVREAMFAYTNAIILLLQKTIENNIKVFELAKERQKCKQDHDYNALNVVNTRLEQLSDENYQFGSDLANYCKPFDLKFEEVVMKYKPHRVKENSQNEEQQANNNIRESNVSEIPQGVYYQMMMEQLSKLKVEHVTTTDQLSKEENDHSVCRGCQSLLFEVEHYGCKDGIIQVFIDVLLLFNSLFEFYLLKDDQFFTKLHYLSANYIEGKLIFDEKNEIHLMLRSFKDMKQDQRRKHNFDNYAYSSLMMLGIVIVWDVIWVLLVNPAYASASENENTFILGVSMWKYNRYVAYASTILLLLKVMMVFLLYMSTDFVLNNLFSKLNFYLCFLKLTNLNYVNMTVSKLNQVVQ